MLCLMPLFALFHWWWDASLGLPRAQVATGVVGAILAVAAIIYARVVAERQFKMMKEQGVIVDKQVELEEEQNGINKRQAALAEK